MKFKNVVATLLLVSAVGVGGYGYYITSGDKNPLPTATQPAPQKVETPVAVQPTPTVAPTITPPQEPAKVSQEQAPAFINGDFNLDNISLITPATLVQKVKEILENTSDEELGTEVGQALLIGRVRQLDEAIYAPILVAIEKQYLDTVVQFNTLKKKEEGLKTRREYELLLAELSPLTTLSEKRRGIAHKAFRVGDVRDLGATSAEIEKQISSRMLVVSKQQSEKYDVRLKELGALEARRWGVYNNAKVKVKEILELLKADSNNTELKIQLADAEQAVLVAWEGPEGVQVVRNERNRVGEEKKAPERILWNARKSILDTLKPMVDDKTYLKCAEKVDSLNGEIKKKYEEIHKKIQSLPKE
jgi:hypothetical protein